MDKKVCRMCGKDRNCSNLLDLSSEITFQIEFHCRILLEDNKLLPQKICFDCNYAVTNFATFSDNAKEIQIRLMMENNLDQVKVEIHELPVVECFLQDDVKQSHRDQPAKKKRKLRSNESSEELYNEVEDPVLADEEINSSNSESEWNNASNSSDSDYQTAYYKKKKKESAKPVKSRRGRKPAVQKKEESETTKDAVELDIAECDKNDDGTITSAANSCFNGEKWCDMRLSCQECDQVVKGPFELKEHYTKQHSPDLSGYEKYQCSECVDTDDNVVQYFHKFLNHYVDHQPFLKFCCLICSEMYWNLDSLQQHYQSNHEQNLLYNCLLCGRFFKTDFYLTSHETRVHKVHINREDGEIRIPNQAAITVESLFADELTGDLFEKENIFKLAANEKNADGSVTEECRNRFTGRTWTSLPLSCLKCDLRQQTAFDLYEHYNNQHTNSKERNFVCSNCPEQKTFFNLESFINHTFTIHHEHLRYFCFICNEICWNYKALYQHFKSEHIEYRANICLYCGKYHKSGYDLKCHSEVHISSKKDEVGTFKCNLCPKSYSRKLQLQRHLDVHKNERSWICETCGTSFKSKSSLINHYMGKKDEFIE